MNRSIVLVLLEHMANSCVHHNNEINVLFLLAIEVKEYYSEEIIWIEIWWDNLLVKNISEKRNRTCLQISTEK